MSLATVLVSGGAGFIGSHVTAELLRRGHTVRVIDNFSTGSRENLAAVGGDVELIEGDIRSYERTHAATKGVDCVIHLAALPSVPRSVQDPLTTNEVNVTGTLNVVLAARDAGTQRVVMASSSSVYGRAQELPKTERLVPQPISPYGVSKLAAEQYCMGLNAVYGIEVAALRYFNVFGPRQDPNSQYSGVIPKFLSQALDGVPLVVFGDGTQSRDFTYVDNVVAATLAASECALEGPLICNVGCGSAHTVLALAEAVGRVAERAVQIEYVPARPGDVLHSFADITVARGALGYDPAVGLQEGLERTLDWMLAERRAGSSAALGEKS
jgi:nucleoside-diphosphate-sugar epimerase